MAPASEPVHNHLAASSYLVLLNPNMQPVPRRVTDWLDILRLRAWRGCDAARRMPRSRIKELAGVLRLKKEFLQWVSASSAAMSIVNAMQRRRRIVYNISLELLRDDGIKQRNTINSITLMTRKQDRTHDQIQKPQNIRIHHPSKLQN